MNPWFKHIGLTPGRRAWALLALLCFFLHWKVPLAAIESRPRTWEWEGVGWLERLRLVSLFETEFQQTDLPLPVLMDEVEYRVQTWFSEKGYLECAVLVQVLEKEAKPSADSEADQDGTAPRLSIRCNRGSRFRLGRITVSGAESLSESELKTTFLNEFDQLWPWSVRWFSNQFFEKGGAAVQAYYRKRGWKNALVETSTVVVAEKRVVEISMTIVEGTRFWLRGLQIESEVPLQDEKTRDLLDSYVDKPYRERIPPDLGVMLAYAFRVQGYPFCEVELDETIDEETGSVLVRYHVTPGPLGTIRSIEPTGNKKTTDRLVLKVASLREDRRYNQKDVDQATLRLGRTRVYQTAQITPQRMEGTPEDVHLDIHVEEAHTKELSTMAGWGSYEKLRGSLNVTHRNLFHRAHQLSTGGMMSMKSERLYSDYSVPYIFGLNLSESIGAFWTHREEPAFERREYGMKEGLTLDIGSKAYLRGGYEFRLSDVYNISSAEVQEEEGDAQISLISLGALYDNRDSPVLTFSGFLLNGNLEWGDQAWGSQVDFLRPTMQSSAFWNPHDRWVFAGSLRLGTEIRVQGGDRIPIQERFFAGGQDTVRGFREGEVGPRDEDGVPIGGERLVIANMEARYRLWKELEVAGFVDVGQVAIDLEKDYENNWQGGYGLGLRYRTPIGPLRMDWAKGVNRTQYDPSSRFYFSIGYPF
jgi:outer membrane protein assembly complex protein YaeT